MAVWANEAPILLSIDQGEELFGAQVQEEVQRFFRILTAAMGGDLPFLAVMTLRSEFLGRLQAAEKDGLTARFEEVSLATMAMAQIPAIIKGPAKVAGLEVEEAFVQQAAADAETEDALPMLAFALQALNERFGGDGHLRLADYQALGDAPSALSPLENAVRLLGKQSQVETFTTSQTLAGATGRNNLIGSIPTGQGAVASPIELKNGELISGGLDSSLRYFLMSQAAIGEACKELQEHPVLLSPKPPPEVAARNTCRKHGFLKGKDSSKNRRQRLDACCSCVQSDQPESIIAAQLFGRFGGLFYLQGQGRTRQQVCDCRM